MDFFASKVRDDDSQKKKKKKVIQEMIAMGTFALIFRKENVKTLEVILNDIIDSERQMEKKLQPISLVLQQRVLIKHLNVAPTLDLRPKFCKK